MMTNYRRKPVTRYEQKNDVGRQCRKCGKPILYCKCSRKGHADRKKRG